MSAQQRLNFSDSKLPQQVESTIGPVQPQAQFLPQVLLSSHPSPVLSAVNSNLSRTSSPSIPGIRLSFSSSSSLPSATSSPLKS